MPKTISDEFLEMIKYPTVIGRPIIKYELHNRHVFEYYCEIEKQLRAFNKELLSEPSIYIFDLI